jgi:hypothetical protein
MIVNGRKLENFNVNLPIEYLDEVKMSKVGDQYKVSGLLQGDNRKGTITNIEEIGSGLSSDFSFSGHNLSVKLFDEKMNTELRAIPVVVAWAVVAGITTVTTVATCAYERRQQSKECQAQYNACISSCSSGNCSYNYTGGLCGGSCTVDCLFE